MALFYSGKKCALDADELNKVKEYVTKNTPYSVNPIIDYVLINFKIKYSPSGIRKLLHSIGFSYKKPNLIGAKANYDDQKKFIAEFNQFSQNIDF